MVFVVPGFVILQACSVWITQLLSTQAARLAGPVLVYHDDVCVRSLGHLPDEIFPPYGVVACTSNGELGLPEEYDRQGLLLPTASFFEFFLTYLFLLSLNETFTEARARDAA